MKEYILTAVALSMLTVGSMAQSVEKELELVPKERVFMNTTPHVGFVSVPIETDDATGECGMGLWIDNKLSVVFYPNEKIQLYLSPDKHELRLSFEPLPEEPRDEEEKKKFKYCKKKEPSKLGIVRELNLKERSVELIKIRSNQGYLHKINVIESNPDKKECRPPIT